MIVGYLYLNLFNLRAFRTTETDENAIAPAEKAGLNNPNAAKGIPMELYINAQKRFCLIFRSVALDSSMALAAFLRSPFTITKSPVSIAISVPVPIAIPTSALAREGESFMPSPAMATK